ncbi:hypothetical protein VTO42DRAFT_8334 [Malbranchea cinnamomea]
MIPVTSVCFSLPSHIRMSTRLITLVSFVDCFCRLNCVHSATTLASRQPHTPAPGTAQYHQPLETARQGQGRPRICTAAPSHLARCTRASFPRTPDNAPSRDAREILRLPFSKSPSQKQSHSFIAIAYILCLTESVSARCSKVCLPFSVHMYRLDRLDRVHDGAK